MISAALAPFDASARRLTLASIQSHLEATCTFRCTRTEWVGYSIRIPQIRVDTQVPLTIQIDSEDYVVPELLEMASDAAAESALPEEQVAFLRRCNARLDIQSADFVGNRHIDHDTRSVTVIASTDLDPRESGVRAVLGALAELTGGPVLDCVNGGWLFVAP